MVLILEKNGIIYKCTCFYTLNQNEVVESKHRHIV